MLRLASVIFITASFVAQATAQGQQVPLEPQPDTWNSTFTLSPAQKSLANISDSVANALNIAVKFERTNWATGSVFNDSFYTTLPDNASNSEPGSLIKVQEFVNVTTYTLAPALALSRIVYMSATLNDTPVPASAYVLWPFQARSHGPKGQIPVVGFGHGQSGIFPECAPSHIRNLWYAYSAPFTLALQGYAVVAPDYAGLGVAYDMDGNEIVHPLYASPAAANDILYAVQAAQKAFEDLSHEFVVAGHSQGGGAAWAVAQKNANDKIPGYLGSVVGSPLTNFSEFQDAAVVQTRFVNTARGIISSFENGPTFEEILTPQGIKLLKLLESVSGCNSALTNLVAGLTTEGDPTKLDVFNKAFAESYWLKSWVEAIAVGGRKVSGPMLILQGAADQSVPERVTTKYVNQTCRNFPASDIEYWVAQGVTHVPVMYAAQRVWWDWIADRFAGKKTLAGRRKECQYRVLEAAARPPDQYNSRLNYFLELATSPYQVA